MAQQPRESFIPKKSSRPAVGISRKARRTALGVFGYVSYAVFFGSVLAAIGMFGVSYYINSTMIELETQLTDVKENFDPGQLQEIQTYEEFMNILERTFNDSVSMSNLFEEFEASIVDSAVIEQISVERDLTGTSTSVVAEASVRTESFDAALFQRSIYDESTRIASFTMNDVTLINESTNFNADSLNEATETVDVVEGDVLYTLELVIDPANLPFDPQPVPPANAPNL